MKQKLLISEHLGHTDRGRNIVKKMNALAKRPDLDFEVIEIPNNINSRNEWCRDFMPIKGCDGDLVLF